MKPQRFIALFLATLVLTFASIVFPVQALARGLVFPDGTLLKASAPEVDQMQGGLRRWIPDSATFSCMGLQWSQVQTISDVAWKQITAGTAFPSRADGTLLKGSGPAVYVMNKCTRHWIPNTATFTAQGYKWNAVQRIADADLKAIPLGAQIPTTTAMQATTLTASWYSQVGPGLFLQTSASMDKSSGLVTATTHTWDTSSSLAFSGGVQIWLLDNNGRVIAATPAHKFAVAGTYASSNQRDRKDTWTEQIDPTIAGQTARLQIVQFPTSVSQSIANAIVGNVTKTVNNTFCAANQTLFNCQS